MKQEKATLDAILNSIVDGVITIDHLGTIASFNNAAESLFGYSADEVVGKNLKMLMPDPDQSKHDGYLKSYLRSGDPKIIGIGRKVMALHKDGNEIPIKLSVGEIETGSSPMFVGIVHDISELDTAVDELELSHSMMDRVNKIQLEYILGADSSAAFDSLLKQILILTHSEYGFIGEVRHKDDGTPYLRTHAITNIAWNEETRKFYDENAPGGMEFINLKTLFGAVLSTGEIVVTNRPKDDPRSGGLPEGHPALNAFLGVPFHIGDRMVGMIGIANRPDGYDESVIELIEPLMATCGNLMGAVESQRQRVEAEEALREANNRLAITVAEMSTRNQQSLLLSKLEELLQACETREEAYEVVAHISKQLFPGLFGALYGLGQDGRHLQVIRAWGEEKLKSTFSAMDCIGVRRGRPHLSAGEMSPLNCHHVDTNRHVSLCVPLIGKNEAFGVLELLAENGNGDTQPFVDIRELAVTVARRIAVTFANLKLSQNLREQSLRDPLTNLYNRRYMMDTLDRELHRARREPDVVVSVAVFDLDYFKRINDEFGHAAGDVVLVEFASLLIKSGRASDVACRSGGEEFALLLPDCQQAIAVERAEQIRKATLDMVCISEGDKLDKTTVSVGVASFPSCGRTPSSLLRVADAALYDAKRAGRNCLREACPLEPDMIDDSLRTRALAKSQ